jgi:hypothetical protein
LNTNRYKFLINTITDWNEPPRARHQVADALARTNQVVFISANRIGLPNLRVLRISDKLEVIIPTYPVDGRVRIRIPLLNRFYQNWLFKKLKQNYPDYIVVNFDFTAVCLFNYFKNVIYYCNDDHIGLSYLLNMKWIARYQDEAERTIAGNSAFCIGTSKFLADKLARFNEKTYEIRLGAPTLNHFKPPARKKDGKSVNVGLVGFIETVNYDLFSFLLSKKELNFTLIGPVFPKYTRILKQYMNVRCTGKLTENNLYEEVGKFDVGIIPYNLKGIIDRTPNKLWLYLALGVPVVISNIKSIHDWSFPEKFVYLSDSKDEFYDNIIKAHKENTKALMEARILFAKSNSWEIRMQEFLTYCSSNIEVD